MYVIIVTIINNIILTSNMEVAEVVLVLTLVLVLVLMFVLVVHFGFSPDALLHKLEEQQ